MRDLLKQKLEVEKEYVDSLINLYISNENTEMEYDEGYKDDFLEQIKNAILSARKTQIKLLEEEYESVEECSNEELLTHDILYSI